MQLSTCTSGGAPNQLWTLLSDGTLRSGLSADLCLTAPVLPPAERHDVNSIIAEHQFIDALGGDYRLTMDSPRECLCFFILIIPLVFLRKSFVYIIIGARISLGPLGWTQIPSIEAPTARCGSHSEQSCLAAVL